MRVSYHVIWGEGPRGPKAARLSIEPKSIVLETVGEEEIVVREVPLDELVAVELRPAASGPGRSARLILKLDGGDAIELETPVERWIVADLLERLFAHVLGGGGGRQRVLLAVKLKPGMDEAVRELLRGGPPFDPQGTALTLHEVYLLEDEALFLFEIDAGVATESLVEPDFWAAAGVWRELIAGGARLAESVYSWRREEQAAGGPHFGLGY
jgi:hypothetical protein